MKSKQSTLRPSLLAKEAFCNGTGPTACVITADDNHVFFAYMHSPNIGLRFSIEEWNRVVEFVDSQALGASDKDWVGDWSKVPDGINYVAKDEDGHVWGCPTEMTFRKHPVSGYWKGSSQGHITLGFLDHQAKNIPFDKSQVKRPGV